MGKYADQLLERLGQAEAWPLPGEHDRWVELAKWIAFRENNRPMLRQFAQWRDQRRRYWVDPVPDRISSAFGSLIFGRPLEVKAAHEANQEALDKVVKANASKAHMQSQHRVVSSEGEVWWRAFVDPDLSDQPIISWYSRTSVIPLFVAGNLAAAAFISLLPPLRGTTDWFRHFEIIDREHVLNVLFRGREDKLGQEVALDGHPETAALNEEWEHGLPSMPCGWVPNRMGAAPDKGISDYEGAEDFFYALNECLTIGTENARSVGKKRMVVPASALNEFGELPLGSDFIVAEAVDEEIGAGDKQSGGPWRVLEYTFDAKALVEWQNQLAVRAFASVGIDAQFAGVSDSKGLAPTGIALRTRLIPSVNATTERTEGWDGELPRQFQIASILASRPVAEGGLGQSGWTNPDDPPTVDRGPPLPEDKAELWDRVGAARTQNIISIEESIEELHSEWSQSEKDLEAERVAEQEIVKRVGTAIGSLYATEPGGAGVGGTVIGAPPAPEPIPSGVAPPQEGAIGPTGKPASRAPVGVLGRVAAGQRGVPPPPPPSQKP